MRVHLIAMLTWKEAARRRLLAAALLLGLLFLAMYALGLYVLRYDATLRGLPSNAMWRQQAIRTMTVMGLYAVNWLMVLMSILSAADTLAGEISSGAIQLVVSKPVRRWEVALGKWIGCAGLLMGYMLFMTGGVLASVWLIAGERPIHLPQLLGLMCLESLLLLSLTLRAGASLSTMATGACGFGLHMLAFLGGWIEEFGQISKSAPAVNLGVAVSLLIPSEALWRRAAFEIRGPVFGGFGRTPFDVGSVPSQWMIVYAALYLAVTLALALRSFSARDL